MNALGMIGLGALLGVTAMACPKGPDDTAPQGVAAAAGQLPAYVDTAAPPFAVDPTAEIARFEGLSVAKTLTKLADRMYVIGETTGKLSDWANSVAGAAAHLRARLQDPEHRPELTAPVKKRSPLAFAAEAGFAEIVEVLLSFDEAKAGIDVKGEEGLTPWGLANLAPKLTLPAINTSATKSPFALVPWLVKTPYYTDPKMAPYARTRAALERAGATRDMAAVKALIATLPRCPDAVKRRVAASDDVLVTLREIVVTDRHHGLPSLHRDLGR